MTETIDRSMLETRDRAELHEIAQAVGVRGVTRMRKADLIDAIITTTTGDAEQQAAPGASGGAGTTRPARQAVGRDGDADGGPTDGAVTALATPLVSITPPGVDVQNGSDVQHAADAQNGSDATHGAEAVAHGEASASAGTATAEPGAAPARFDEGDSTEGGDGRGFAGDAGRRGRRRRRGRDRERGGGGGGGGGGGDRGERDSYEPRQGGNEPVGDPVDVEGLLDVRDEGYGFLRAAGYLPGQRDAYVSASQIRRFGLRRGDFVVGATRPAASNEKYPALLRVDTINGLTADEARVRPKFESLTPLFPDEKLSMEIIGDPTNLTGRIVDLISPIGKGQRGLIVSPPKAGKTTIMKQIVSAIEANNPEVHLMVLLVDERPEEVTDMRRHVLRGEVSASTFDRPSEEHTHVAELTIERAKRLVEMGRDVVIMLDGITRLARAYNLAAPASGRILSGGVDSGALYPPKKFFGAARNIEEGGSLTILATALIETGSKMDEVIFEEFKGTGNMELRLDRRLAERRIYPAIDVDGSSTRHEELLFERPALQSVWKLRRVLSALEDGAGLELLLDKLRTTRSNDEFLSEIAKAPSAI